MEQTTKNGRSNHEIIASISRRQWLLKLLQLLLFLCVIGAFLGIVSGALIWERDYQKGICRCVAGVICIVGGVLLAKGNKKLTHSLKVQIGEYVVHDILAEKVAITEYAPDQHIGRSFVDSCSILPNYDRISGSDYISGTYRDVPFRYCDLLLERKTQERDEDGHQSTSYHTVFQGQVLRMEFGKELDGYVRIREKKDKSRTAAFFGGILKNVKNALFTEQDGEEIETENAEFNRQFKIKASDGELAFYILTPQFMESVLRLDALADGYTNIVFRGGGVTLTLNNGRDSFELKRTLRNRNICNVNRPCMIRLVYGGVAEQIRTYLGLLHTFGKIHFRIDWINIHFVHVTSCFPTSYMISSRL